MEVVSAVGALVLLKDIAELLHWVVHALETIETALLQLGLEGRGGHFERAL